MQEMEGRMIRVKVWAKDPAASNLWGIMPGDEMHK
jgi:hypothetical protein